ncbi:MAG: hypothetical protein Q9195_007210 [Heterodermia aff. obscurata]
MDGFDVSTAPAAYQEVKWVADVFIGLMGLGWCTNYACMIRQSFRDQSYGMAVIPLCSNIGWELVYVLVYPSKSYLERFIFVIAVSLNLGVMYSAILFSPKEWSHAPLVRDNLPILFAAGVILCFTGQLALAMQIGPSLGYSWGAAVCQILLSVGGLGQLLARNSTRGSSRTVWLSRYLGSCFTVVFAGIRYLYWPEAFAWLSGPLMMWCLAVFFITDALYGACFARIRSEEEIAKTKRAKEGGSK